MQGLARFSLVAVIVLAAILLGTWAYLTARYGSVEEFMASDDAPRYWQPIRSEAHDDEPVESDGRSLTEKTADAVKAGKIPEGEYGGWRKVEPEKTPDEKPSSRAEAAPLDTIEARIDTEFSDLAIDTDEGTFKRGDSKSSLKPFFARTMPDVLRQRAGYTDSNTYDLMTKTGGSKSPELQRLEKEGVVVIHGKVVDNQQRVGIGNVVVAPIVNQTQEPSALRAVTNSDGEFVLYLPGADVNGYSVFGRKARFAVIADGLDPNGRRDTVWQVSSEADANGAHEVRLERSRGLRVRVRISNPRPAEDGVRVWCELRSESGPLFDDNIFMSIDVPKSGEVVFRMPRSHFGKVRVGACGNGWASEVYETEKITKDIVATKLDLVAASTRFIRGVVCDSWFADGHSGEGIKAARVGATESSDLTYTDSNGHFEFSLRTGTAGEPSVRVSNIAGVSRVYKFQPLSRDAEDRFLIRSAYDSVSNSRDWQLLFPVRVTLMVRLATLPEIDERTRYPVYLNLVPNTDAPLSKLEKMELRKLLKQDQYEYEFSNVPWGSFLVVFATQESKGSTQSLGTYTSEDNCWNSPEVVLEYPQTQGACFVKVSVLMELIGSSQDSEK